MDDLDEGIYNDAIPPSGVDLSHYNYGNNYDYESEDYYRYGGTYSGQTSSSSVVIARAKRTLYVVF